MYCYVRAAYANRETLLPCTGGYRMVSVVVVRYTIYPELLLYLVTISEIGRASCRERV